MNQQAVSPRADKNGSKTAIERDPRGRFVPGNKGGPGRPPVEFSVREMLRSEVQQRPAAVKRIMDLCESEDEHVAVKAILGLAQFLDGVKGTEVNVNIDQRSITLQWDDGSKA